MMEKLQDMPVAAQYVILGAGGLLCLLLALALVLMILKIHARISKSRDPKDKIPRILPVAPIQMLTENEVLFYRRLLQVIRNYPNFSVHTKISARAIFGPRAEESPKVARAIHKQLIDAVHDFVILDRDRYPVAVIEMEGEPDEARDAQVRRTGIALLRVGDASMKPAEIEQKLQGIIK